MQLTDRQIELVQESFETLMNSAEHASSDMYERLFRRAPHLKPMFRDDLEGQGMKFMTTLGLIVEGLRDPESLTAKLDELGEGHAVLGVKTEHFDYMGDALMLTLAAMLGDRFTPELESAWRQAYGSVSAAVIEHGHIKGEQG